MKISRAVQRPQSFVVADNTKKYTFNPKSVETHGVRLDDEINDIVKTETQALRLYEKLMNCKVPE